MGLTKEFINRPQKITIIVVLIMLISALIVELTLNNKIEIVLVNINNQKIRSELVYQPNDLYRGLSGRKSLPENGGMLFNFDESGIRDFVMKDMNFPLDIIFISDNTVVKIFKNLPPEGNNPQKIYNSGVAIDKALEVPAGYTELKDIKVGDRILITRE
ncbi:MAG: DUF192 domain-containing protein [Patescibacteria group bacterium]